MALTIADFLKDVAVVFTGSNNAGAFGSGRLIAPGLLLTAGHVVDFPTRQAPVRKGWKIRLIRERAKDGSWTMAAHEAELLWRGSGDLDLALVQLSGDIKPSLTQVIASFDQVGVIDDVDAAGFPEAWNSATGNLRDYTARGRLRLAAQFGPYVWTVSPADKPDDPQRWKGMSGAGVCCVGPDDKVYIFGAVQQVPANFSGGLLEVARISEGMADKDFLSHLQTAWKEKPVLVPWVKATSYGFSEPVLTELLEKLKDAQAIPAGWVDRQEKLAERAAVSEQALLNIARRLGVENIPTGELGSALMDRIDRLHAAQQQVQALPPDNPIKPFAAAAAESGEYHHAESLLAVAADQIRALQLVEGGQHDSAVEALEDALGHLGDLSAASPDEDRVVQGYIYKTLGQAFSAKGDKIRANQSFDKAIAVFQGLAHETIPVGNSVTPFAEAMNGLGNLEDARGQHREAIGYYKLATSLVPDYAYAWHDMFLSYYALAEQKDVNLKEMRQALAKTKQTGVGWPNLDAERFARLDRMMEDFTPKKPTGKKKAAAPSADARSARGKARRKDTK